MARSYLPRLVIAVLFTASVVLSVVAWRQHLAIAVLTDETKAMSEKYRSARMEAAKAAEPMARPLAPDVTPAPTRFSDVRDNVNLINAALLRRIIPRPPFLSPNGTKAVLSMHFTAAFSLNQDEVTALEEALSSARHKVIELEAASTVASRDAKGALILVTRATPDGATIHDEVRAAFRTVLGDERYVAFAENYSKRVDDFFGDFGVQERRISVRTFPDKPELYTVQETSKRVGDEFGRTDIRRDIPRKVFDLSYPALARFLPPETETPAIAPKP
jgi:hypothetical protein